MINTLLISISKIKLKRLKKQKVFDNEFKDETRKYRTKSELIVVKATNERYFILYQLEQREIEQREIEQREFERESAYITQCYIFKYNSE